MRFVVLPSPDGIPVVVERGEPSFLYLNRSGGRFVPAVWHTGVFREENGGPLPEAPTDWSLSVLFRDLNGDGLPDLYVCNDFVHWADRLWLNKNSRRFQAAPRQTLRHVSLSSMAVDAADINRDGFDDFFVADMLSPRREARAWQRPDLLHGSAADLSEDPGARPETPRNTLQLARGDGTFAEIAPLAGVAATDWTTSALFLDVDLDGWEDLLLVGGNKHDVQDADVLARLGPALGAPTPEERLAARRLMPSRPVASRALRNRRDLTFEDVSAAWGFNAVGVGHGMALGDLDNDGDLDVVVNCMNEPARIYRNNSPAPRVAVRLKGSGGNTRGIGARIKVTGGPVTQTQVMMAGGRFCSSDDPMRVFAAGTASRLGIEITWRSGRRSLVTNAEPNCVYEIDEAGALPDRPPAPAPPEPLFEDASSAINHTNVDEPFDDFARQPLLPRKLSTLGPGVSWVDLDGSGRDGLLIGAGKGEPSSLSSTTTARAGSLRGRRRRRPRRPRGTKLPRSCFIPGRDRPGSSWENPTGRMATPTPPFSASSRWAPRPRPVSPPSHPCPPPSSGRRRPRWRWRTWTGMAGWICLSGAARCRDGIPKPADSYLFHNDGTGFSLAQTFTNLGLVSGAVFVDYDGDGQPDLALACEWDSIRLFHNDRGRFTEVTAAFGARASSKGVLERRRGRRF